MKRLKGYQYIRRKPQVSLKTFIASGVRLIGAVVIGDYSSIWYNTVIRADINKIEIGSHTNIQDMCTLHVSGGQPNTKN
jgi:carbonic anhydrase/acetyltransferase-like protein (isoleucine patch superfamily)